MIRRMIRAGACLALLGLASTALAQGPRSFGLGGGPGFGPPGMRVAPGGSSIMLLDSAEVQKELGITEAQKEKISELQTEARSNMEKMFRAFDPTAPQEDTAEEREKQFAATRKKMEEDSKAIDDKLSKLLEAKQLDRLKQLRLQREGIAALSRADIAKQLSLTEEQQTKLRGLQPTAFFGPPRPNPRALQNALAVLNDEQKAKWAELTGPEFKFPEIPFGPPGMGGQERKLVDQFDKDEDGKLNSDERKLARVAAKAQPAGGPGMRGLGGRRPGGPGPRGRAEPGKPGPKVSPQDVTNHPDVELYDTTILRTLFFTFENEDWEQELADFHNTDVEVPATLMVDGKEYKDVGLHFRGMSSYGMVPAGSKRSLNVSIDHGDAKQRLYGYKTLNLLNAHEDASFMHTVLYSQIARKHIPAPKANFVKVVINGESWGVYVNAQQFDKVFVAENFASPKGTRWKVSGSPGGGGGLDYLGDNIADYKRRYEMKSDDKDDAWRALIKLCKTLEETPPEKLEAALEPILDIDGALWFLAIDNALINNDGYWVRGSDYCIFLDGKGKFHIVPHDMNEAFHAPMGPGGFGGGPGGASGGSGLALDPLIGLDDASKPLRSKLLAVPGLQEKYLRYVRTIAEDSLDWAKLGPMVDSHRRLIAKEVEADTRKLSSFAAFEQAFSAATLDESAVSRRQESLRAFADGRRKALLSHPAIEKLVKP